MENYCTVEDVKEVATDMFSGGAEDDYDAALVSAIPKASRVIDAYMHQEDGYYVAETSATARYFSGSGKTELSIDDCIEIEEVAYREDETTWTAWASTDYQEIGPDLTPNRLPIGLLRVDPYGDHSVFPEGDLNIRVKAKWGYSVLVPELIKAACIAQTLYAFKRAQQGYQDQGGITGAGVVLYVRGLCKDAKDFLDMLPKRVDL